MALTLALPSTLTYPSPFLHAAQVRTGRFGAKPIPASPKVTSGAPRSLVVTDAVREVIARHWRDQVTPRTGLASYDELTELYSAEFAASQRRRTRGGASC